MAGDLRAEIVGLLRARDCAMSAQAVAEVFTVMGNAAEEVEAALEALVRAGEAVAAGGQVRLSPGLCRAEPAAPRIAPLPWIEERLAEAPGCRMPLLDLGRLAEAEGVRLRDMDRVLPDLIGLGRIVPEGRDLRLRGDLCLGGRPEDRAMDRIMGLGRDGFRSLLGLVAITEGCRLALGEREALMRKLRAEAMARFLPGRVLSADAQAALDLRIGQALDDPGPAYRIDGDVLVARYCLP